MSELETAMLETSERLVRISKWIDAYPPNARRDPEALLWSRVSKVGEEFGEVMEAMIGVTDQNPRKGITHDMNDVRKELLDVALTALAAYEHIDGHSGLAMVEFAFRVKFVLDRLDDGTVTYHDGISSITKEV